MNELVSRKQGNNPHNCALCGGLFGEVESSYSQVIILLSMFILGIIKYYNFGILTHQWLYIELFLHTQSQSCENISIIRLVVDLSVLVLSKLVIHNSNCFSMCLVPPTNLMRRRVKLKSSMIEWHLSVMVVSRLALHNANRFSIYMAPSHQRQRKVGNSVAMVLSKSVIHNTNHTGTTH